MKDYLKDRFVRLNRATCASSIVSIRRVTGMSQVFLNELSLLLERQFRHAIELSFHGARNKIVRQPHTPCLVVHLKVYQERLLIEIPTDDAKHLLKRINSNMTSSEAVLTENNEEMLMGLLATQLLADSALFSHHSIRFVGVEQQYFGENESEVKEKIQSGELVCVGIGVSLAARAFVVRVIIGKNTLRRMHYYAKQSPLVFAETDSFLQAQIALDVGLSWTEESLYPLLGLKIGDRVRLSCRGKSTGSTQMYLRTKSIAAASGENSKQVQLLTSRLLPDSSVGLFRGQVSAVTEEYGIDR